MTHRDMETIVNVMTTNPKLSARAQVWAVVVTIAAVMAAAVAAVFALAWVYS